jgi:hypothetical protein
MTCVHCGLLIEGEVIRCGCMMCGGSEGRIELNGVIERRFVFVK